MIFTVNKQLATEMAAQLDVQYLSVVRSFSSKNKELHGAPQSFKRDISKIAELFSIFSLTLTIFPATFNSYPITCGDFSCTGPENLSNFVIIRNKTKNISYR